MLDIVERALRWRSSSKALLLLASVPFSEVRIIGALDGRINKRLQRISGGLLDMGEYAVQFVETIVAQRQLAGPAGRMFNLHPGTNPL